MSQSPSRFVFSNVIVDVSIQSCRSFVISRSRASFVREFELESALKNPRCNCFLLKTLFR